jgi:pyruvate/2-oxoglutarate dehydrogenase complex dihydrolipoamide acyltransferase (E2) component
MGFEIKVPDLGDGVVGKVLKINVKVGDKITKDTIIADINTDKVDAEVPAEVEGTITAILIKEGDEAKMGDIMMTVETGDTAASAPVKDAATTSAPVKESAPTTGGAEISLTVPDLGEGVVSIENQCKCWRHNYNRYNHS